MVEEFNKNYKLICESSIAKQDLLTAGEITTNFYESDTNTSYFVYFKTDFLSSGSGIAKMGGCFGFDNHQNLNTIPTYYVDSNMPLSNNITDDNEKDDGVLYSHFILFSYWISNFEAIQSQMTAAPQYTITCTSGNIDCVQGGDLSGRSMDLYLMSMPNPGLAEFEASCVVAGETHTQTIKITGISFSEQSDVIYEK